MKKVLLLLCVLFQVEHISALNILIIESQSTNVGHVMDTQWYNLVISLGHTASIQPQTALDDTLFFTNTDILIVSSGVITLPSNRVMTIQQYLQYGGKVYLQSEYQVSYTTNQAFESIVNALGGTFSWTGASTGDLIPMNSFGTLSTTPNAVSPLDYFWYGTYGSGCNGIEPFLEYNALHYGFIFCCPASAGRMITTSDQDWVRTADSIDLELMENIIYNLALSAYTCPFTSQPTITALGNTLTSSAAGTYQWYNNAGPITGATSQTYVVPSAGYYHVCVTDSNECTACSDSVLVKIVTGVSEAVSENTFYIYPNQENGFIIKCKMQDAELKVFDTAARMVFIDKIRNSTMYTWNPKLPMGIYFVQLRDGERIFTEKLAIK